MPRGSCAIPLTKSWANPSKLKVTGNDFENKGHDSTDLAFHPTCKRSVKMTTKIGASEEWPIAEPAFVVNNRAHGSADLQVNGRVINHGKDSRVGHRERRGGTDLIIWFRAKENNRAERKR